MPRRRSWLTAAGYAASMLLAAAVATPAIAARPKTAALAALTGATVGFAARWLRSHWTSVASWALAALAALVIASPSTSIALSILKPVPEIAAPRSSDVLWITVWATMLLGILAPIAVLAIRATRDRHLTLGLIAAGVLAGLLAKWVTATYLPVEGRQYGPLLSTFDSAPLISAGCGAYLGIVVFSGVLDRPANAPGADLQKIVLLAPLGVFFPLVLATTVGSDLHLTQIESTREVALGIVPALLIGAVGAGSCAITGKRRRLRRSIALIVSIIAMSVTITAYISYTTGNSARVIKATFVSVPYDATIRYASERWLIDETFKLDSQAESQLFEYAGEELSRRLQQGSGSPPSPYSHEALVPVLQSLYRHDPGSSTQLAASTLHLSAGEVECLARICATTPDILRRIEGDKITDALNEHGWLQATVIDGEPTYEHTRQVSASVPKFGATTSAIEMPQTEIFSDVYLRPRSHSTVMIRAPKAMIVGVFPKEVSQTDTLLHHEEEFVVDLGSGDTTQVRVAALAWILRSEPGQLLYRTGQWPALPYLVGAMFALLLWTVRERVQDLLKTRLASPMSRITKADPPARLPGIGKPSSAADTGPRRVPSKRAVRPNRSQAASSRRRSSMR